MRAQLLNRNVISNKALGDICAGACSLVGASVLVLGFRRLERMELTEAQLYSATLETLLLGAAFAGLALGFGWRRTS